MFKKGQTMIDALGLSDVALPLLVSIALGAIVGLERQIHGRWAGPRTHMVVSLGSAAFVLASMEMLGDSSRDATRVIQGVSAGVGFIGAGTILKLSGEMEIKGLTTASTIWLSAAVGVASGLSNYRLAIWTTIFAMLVLALLRPLEKKLNQ